MRFSVSCLQSLVCGCFVSNQDAWFARVGLDGRTDSLKWPMLAPFIAFVGAVSSIVVNAVTGGKSSIDRGGKEDTTPSEDPVWGLHVVREYPRRPPGSIYTVS